MFGESGVRLTRSGGQTPPISCESGLGAGSRLVRTARARPCADAIALYISSILCGERRTQREVADVAGVTEVTIRNRYKELAEKLDIDIIL